MIYIPLRNYYLTCCVRQKMTVSIANCALCSSMKIDALSQIMPEFWVKVIQNFFTSKNTWFINKQKKKINGGWMSVWSLFYQLTAQHIKFFRLPFHSNFSLKTKKKDRNVSYACWQNSITTNFCDYWFHCYKIYTWFLNHILPLSTSANPLSSLCKISLPP